MSIIFALWKRNMRAFLRNKPALIFNLVFPFFFLFIFGNMFRTLLGDGSETYMLAGIIIATVFESSFRISSTTIDDMTSGFMKEVLVSPISRLNIAAGQFVSSATISAFQGLMIFVAGFAIGMRVSSPLTVVWAILAMVFIGLLFSGFGLFIASKAKNLQTFQAVTMALTMPLMFLSGAYLPTIGLPNLLRNIAAFNPLTYAVNIFRTIVMERFTAPTYELVNETLAANIGGTVVNEQYVIGDVIHEVRYITGGVNIGMLASIGILLAFGLIFLTLSTIAFARVDFSKMNRNVKDSIEL
ncbi:MAG: ABC transporter permease [Oscillospiraceae bacterium]|nr:ABC transporter permease [Oscillospiraceae bacterium]